jgi:hypothetical protein
MEGRMSIKSFFIFILLASTLMGCSISSRDVGPTTTSPEIPTLEFDQPTSLPTASPTLNLIPSIAPPPSKPPTTQQIVVQRAFAIINALKNKDMNMVSQYVSLQMGLRFSPYATVKDTDQVFPADKLAGMMADPTVYLWGNYDGSGEPINLTFAEYYTKFVYDEDFANAPQLALNHRLGTGNSIDNIQEFYPGAMVVEFYFPGFDPQYAGMDWRSLRMVFMQEGNDWFLVDIIHDQWTI